MDFKGLFFNSLYILGFFMIVHTIVNMVMITINRHRMNEAVKKAIREGNFNVVCEDDIKKLMEEDEEDGE